MIAIYVDRRRFSWLPSPFCIYPASGDTTIIDGRAEERPHASLCRSSLSNWKPTRRCTSSDRPGVALDSRQHDRNVLQAGNIRRTCSSSWSPTS